MYSSESDPPTIVVVGNYGVGKSSCVQALLGDANTTNGNNEETVPTMSTKKKRESDDLQMEQRESSEFEMEQSELIVESRTVTLYDDMRVRIVDTAARDVTGTQHQMQSADLVVMVLNSSSPKSIEDMDAYWLEQLNDISLFSPVMACFNQIDRLKPSELKALKSKFCSPTKEHFVHSSSKSDQELLTHDDHLIGYCCLHHVVFE